ncbi:MAG: FAD-binding oxidoreductase [Acidimicrobiia bacterium]
MPDTNSIDLASLRSRITGSVTTPTDDRYDESRKLFYGMVEGKPSAIVRVASASDVSAVLQIAHESGVEVAVRSGGHSLAGHSTTDGGLVIDVRSLNDLDIDVDSASVWAGAGVTAAEYTTAAGEFGLGTGFGDTGSVGISGITLGGGVGFLVRKYGLTVDSLLAAEIVTADGQVLLTDPESHPDLFWAIRGGGGNFGVVTRLQFALHPVDPFVGGFIALPATAEVIEGFLALSESAPEDLSTIANVMSAPPMPFIPEELVGKTVVMGIIAWCGPVESGQTMIERFRALGEPLLDMLAVMPYPQMYPPEDEDYAPTGAANTGFAERVDTKKIATILEEIETSDAPLRAVQLRALGGAMARIPNDATAFAHRDRNLMVNVAAFYEGEEDRPRRETWVRSLSNMLTEGDTRGYVGFLADEGSDRIRAAYPGPTWDRLREVKAKYDPENLFRRNQNIPPAT